MSDLSHVQRLHTNDLELGATEAIQKHYERHVVSTKAVSQRKLDFERARPRWLREMMAEAEAIRLLFVDLVLTLFRIPGLESSSTSILALPQLRPFCSMKPILHSEVCFKSVLHSASASPLLSSLVVRPREGNHFNPAMTICFATWQGFPWKKVPYYIFAQIFGAFMAGLFVYGQYHEQIVAYSAATIAAGKGTVFNGGPASIFCSFPGETQTNLGYLFMIEFFVDSYIGIIIWACLDPANPFVSPQAAPWAIDLADGIPTPLPLNNPTDCILCLAYST
ncbi:aquaporin-like protein, partial [Aureobasidium pullulans]